MTRKFDVVIIGSGPGGYVAAIRCAQLGFKTACIEKNKTLGGTCLNVGCIPSKSLLYSSEFYYKIREYSKSNGIEISKMELNFSQMMERKDKIVKGLTDSVSHLMDKNKIDIIHGEASFVDSHTIQIGSENIESSFFILAAGSEPIPFPNTPFDEKTILSSSGALDLKKIPETLLIVGGGVIGVEIASVYQRLGTKVTVIELLEHICMPIDLSISKALLKSLTKQGITFSLSSKVTRIEKNQITFTKDEQEHTLSADHILIAIGRRPYSKNLNLEKIGVKMTSKGFVDVNSTFQTTIPNIYAIGDLIEGPMLAHKASAEGIAVAEFLAGMDAKMNYLTVPNVIYTEPEVAVIGFSEEEAKSLRLDLKIGTALFKGNPRARCCDQTEGFVKIIGDEATNRLIGMHIIGSHASEMISEGMAFLENYGTLADVAYCPNAHPTLSEAIKEAALNALQQGIHE